MRASLYLVGFAAASLVGVGLVEVGCSSSSSPATPPANDAAATDETTIGDDGGDGGGDAAPTPCTPLVSGVSVATFDAGALWGCFQTKCATSLTACGSGSDCLCNNAVIKALECQVDGGSTTTCFTPIYMADTAGMNVITCLQAQMTACGVSLDGGVDGATDAGHGTDASDAGAPDTGAVPADAGDAGDAP